MEHYTGRKAASYAAPNLGEGLEIGVRWKWGLLLLASGIMLWPASMIASPHTAWGIEHEQLRAGVARLSGQLAAAAFVLILVAGLAIYSNRDGCR